jgi:hypothetical protein
MGELILMGVLLGLIPAMIASSKGRSFIGWWIYGALLFLIALVHSLIIREDPDVTEKRLLEKGLVKCPSCAEAIKPEAVVCKHCGRDIPAQTA